MIATDKTISITESKIPGLYIVDLDLRNDDRGWFKENYQKQKMEDLGLPEFEVVQNNFSYNKHRGVTRGLHAEPWEKFISIANGRVFGAWVDLRKGTSFGTKLSIEINPGMAVFVPRGVANGYQTLEDEITYTYLVNEHWSPDAKYTFVNLFDREIGIDWPIKASDAIVSEKDATHPAISDIIPVEF